MKKILVIILGLITFVSCNNNKNCVIEGTVNNSDLNGKRIFLVPIYHEDSLGVDSVVIENNKFRFERNQEFLADIRLDFRHRQGTENLLIITEPGTVKVVIDSISHGGGTPQNDALQSWKESLKELTEETRKYRAEYTNCIANGDTLKAVIFVQNIKIVLDQHNKRTKQLTEKLKSGTLYDFLIQRLKD